MTAIRSVRAAEGKFVQISNAALQDERLSWRARGILAFVLSMPPDRTLTAKWLETQAPDGREAVRSALRELGRYGYYHRDRRKGPRGIWVWDQVISDAPITADEASGDSAESAQADTTYGNPYAGNPSAEEPSDKELNTETPNTEDQKMASRRAHASSASANWTIDRVVRDVRTAVAQECSRQEADDLTDGEALGLFYSKVGNRRPHDLVAYLAKILGDAPYLDTFLANVEPACTSCAQWESNCACPVAA